jgi:hypothetical protein
MPAESNEMTNIAFIEIDGPIANYEARFALAESIASREFVPGTRDWKDAFWHVAFTPENVSTDVLVPGAYEALVETEKTYEVILLTSRPEHMREATRQWLTSHRIGVGRDLVMKPASCKWDKTLRWKTTIIHTFAYMYGASEVLAIDPVQDNTNELQRYTTSFAMRYYKSLDMQEPTDDEIRDEF